MKTIYKYTLQMNCANHISLNKKSEVVKFAIQNNQPCIWVICDTDNITENRIFGIVGTGWKIEENMRYIDTAFEGPFVWHLFEQVKSSFWK